MENDMDGIYQDAEPGSEPIPYFPHIYLSLICID
jgi:hypothetical protein